MVVLVQDSACLFHTINHSLYSDLVEIIFEFNYLVQEDLLLLGVFRESVYVVLDVYYIWFCGLLVLCDDGSEFLIQVVMQLVDLSLLLSNEFLFISGESLKFVFAFVDSSSFLGENIESVGLNVHKQASRLLNGIFHIDNFMKTLEVVFYTNLTHSLFERLDYELGFFVDMVHTRIDNIADSSRVVFIEIEVLDCVRASSFCPPLLVLRLEPNGSHFRDAARVITDFL